MNLNHKKQHTEKGKLEVICGSMFSGKTEELMRRLKRAEYAKQEVLTIKHHIDKRFKHVSTALISHEGKERDAFVIIDSPEGVSKIIELAKHAGVIGIDEVQFFGEHILDVINYLVEQGKRVLVAGLDLDFRGEPFGIMPLLMAYADEVSKLKAICVKCGSDAHHTQRLINGKPAAYNDPIVLVGASDFYEARCRSCFKITKSSPSAASAHVVSLEKKQQEASL